jgi:hypothetical protein
VAVRIISASDVGLYQVELLPLSQRFSLKTSDILSAWRKILKGERPSLSIEITRECPLRCPGCYAYDAAHLGGGVTPRSLKDRKGQGLIDDVVDLVDSVKCRVYKKELAA